MIHIYIFFLFPDKTVDLLFKGTSQHYTQLATDGDAKDGNNVNGKNALKHVRLLGSGQYVSVNNALMKVKFIYIYQFAIKKMYNCCKIR